MGLKPKRKPPNAGKGRPKGTPNKFTGLLKDVILQSLAEAGGVEYLRKQATKHPAPYMALIGRVLPLQIRESGDEPTMPKSIIHEHRPASPVTRD